MAGHLTLAEWDRKAQLRRRAGPARQRRPAASTLHNPRSTKELTPPNNPAANRVATRLKDVSALSYTKPFRAVRIVRGTNEPTNGLIRQYFPKVTDFRDISHAEVRLVEKLLNNRRRARLGFRTAAEVFFERNPPAGCD